MPTSTQIVSRAIGACLVLLLLTGTLFSQTSADQKPSVARDSAIGNSPQEPITLQEAIQIALEKNPMRKMALADQKAAFAGVKQAQAMLLPHIGFSEIATLGNDPVYVFGTRLRQQRFTAADFALNQLNRPTPIGNFSSRFGGEWTLFDSLASWRNLSRTRFMQQAASQQLERTDQELVFHAVQAYYGLLLAQKQLDVAEQSRSYRAVAPGSGKKPIRLRPCSRIRFSKRTGKRRQP